MRRRYFLGMSAGLMAMGAMSAPSSGRPIRLIVGFPPGGSVDGLARITAEVLASSLERPVVVDNRPGAAGRLAVEAVRSAAPDGETLLVSPQGPMTLFPYVFKDLRFDPARDFTPIARIGVSDLALSVGPMVPARDLAGLRDWLTTAGDGATFGSPGAGTIVHFAGVAVSQLLGVKMIHVPYQGSAKSMIDLAGRVIATAFSPVTEALELHKAGRVRILATMGSVRSTFVPEAPTLLELGHDFELQGWNAIYGPAGLPQAMVDAVEAGVARGLATAESTQRLASLGVIPAPLGPQALEVLREKESAMWERIVRRSGFKPNA